MKAAIDIGTNSVRMLVGIPDGDKIMVKMQFVEETRLGEGIKSRRLSGDAIFRTVEVLRKFRNILSGYDVSEVVVIATSAVRDAVNKNEFSARVFQAAGWNLRVLSGEEEAFFSYRGAVSVLPRGSGVPVVIDIGGGSTEIIFSTPKGLRGSSVNVGAVRLKEDPLSNEELCQRFDPAVQGIRKFAGPIRAVGVGGTATTAAAVLNSVTEYTRDAVQGKALFFNDLYELKKHLEDMTLEERKNVPGLSPARADIIVPGLEILIAVLNLLKTDRITASDAGILDGLLLEC